MRALGELRRAGAQVVAAAGIPYGYTLTIWGAGALCTGRFGLPTPPEGFEFVGGASLGYFGLALLLRRAGEANRRGDGLPVLWENGAALPALATTYGLAQVMPGAGASFFLVPLVATVFYLVGVSLMVAWLHPAHEPEVEHHRRRPPCPTPVGAGSSAPVTAPDGVGPPRCGPFRPGTHQTDTAG